MKRDELAELLAKTINEQSKDGKLAYFLDDKDAPVNVTDFISTGNTMLDLAISNRKGGGFPVGRIIEVTGLEQSGKSLLACHAIAETQKRGGIGVLLDTESSVSKEFLEAIGVDVKNMIWAQVDTIETVFELIELMVTKIRTTNKDKSKLVTIVVDSIAAATSNKEAAADYDKDGYNTEKAIVISKALRKITNVISKQNVTLICTNQLRQKLGIMFGDPWTTSGGKSLQFHSSVRLRLKKLVNIVQKIHGIDTIVGVKVQCTVIKNRIGPPLRVAHFDIMFQSGIDNYGSWLDVMKQHKIVTQSGAWYSYNDTKFQTKDFIAMVESSPETKEEFYDRICDALILKYKKQELSEHLEYKEDEPVVAEP